MYSVLRPNNTTLPKCMSHDLYMFIIATSSMFMTATFIPYHSFPAHPNYHLHYSCPLCSSCTAVVNRSASLCCPSLGQVFSTVILSMFTYRTLPTVCIYTSSFTPLSYQFPAIPALHYYFILPHEHGPLAIPRNK